MYTVVKPDFVFPDIEYEVLADLYLPEEGREDDLEYEALAITGNLEPEDELPSSGTTSRKRKPQGHIKVQDTELTEQPVKGVKVRALRWFKISVDHTDGNGYFSMSKKYNKARIKVIFKSDLAKVRAIRGWRIWQALYAVRKYIGTISGGGLTNIKYTFNNSDITNVNGNVKKYYTAAHIMSAVWDFKAFCLANDLPAPPKNLRIWTTNKIASAGGAASAPMLSKLGSYDFMTPTNTFGSIWEGAIKRFLIASHLSLFAYPRFRPLMMAAAPDITIPFNNFYNSDRLRQIIHHELGHALQYRKVGNAYWKDYIVYILDNNGYGDGTAFGAPMIALSEAYAEDMAAICSYGVYGNNASFFLYPNHLEYIEKRNKNSGGFIPEGMFYDMHDDNTIGTEGTGIVDNVSGFSYLQLYSAHGSWIRSPQQYRQRLGQLYGTQQNQLYNLCQSYGY